MEELFEEIEDRGRYRYQIALERWKQYRLAVDRARHQAYNFVHRDKMRRVWAQNAKDYRDRKRGRPPRKWVRTKMNKDENRKASV